MDTTRALKRAVDQYPGGTAALAALMDMSPTTLRHKANPHDSKQFFSPEEALQLQLETGDHGALQVDAAVLGYVLLRNPAALSTDEAAQLINGTVREFSEFLTECTSTLADGRVTANELRAVDDELASAIAQMQAMRAHLAGLHQAGKPAAERGAA